MNTNSCLLRNEERLSQKAGSEAKKAAEQLEKDSETAKDTVDSWSKQVKKSVEAASTSVSNGISQAVSQVRSATTAAACRARSIAGRSWEELHNPVVLLNVLLGSGALSGLLAGYAQYDARYLKGKSDGAVLATVGGTAAILAIDALLSAKYYKKYSK